MTFLIKRKAVEPIRQIFLNCANFLYILISKYTSYFPYARKITAEHHKVLNLISSQLITTLKYI